MKIPRFLTLLFTVLFSGLLLFTLASCSKDEEMTLEEAQALKVKNQEGIMAGTIKKPGGTDIHGIGIPGGTWQGTFTSDPKTFNLVTADGEQGAMDVLTGLLPGYLASYDPYSRQWESETADFEIVIYDEEDRLDVIFTLRDDLFWSYYDSNEKVKITADDVLFWYDEIYGNQDFQHSAYNGQFLTMSDGSQARVEIEKLGELRLAFHFPRIVANPILSCNMMYGPRFIYEPLLREKGASGLKESLTIDIDIKTLPSGGARFLTEYTPGVRLVYENNPDYWEKDDKGQVIPYIEKSIAKIVPDINTSFLLFKNGETESYGIRAEDLEELVSTENPDYDIYDGGAGLGSNFISFNQNPAGLPEPMLSWFTQKEFRQAMSRLTNRNRIIKQIYRGMGVPALHHFAVANPYYDETLVNKYSYNPDEALKLLASIGIKQDEAGLMRDSDGNALEFDMITNAENNLRIDIVSIFADECSKVGIRVNVRPLDFQKMVEMLLSSFDWHSIVMGFGGSNYWPTGGSNIWPSTGNLHLWNPLQSEAATEWEARVDYLYNEGSFTPDPVEAKQIWDEYQSILLEELPLFYLAHTESFVAIRKRWDNVFYDTLGGLSTEYLFLKESE
jgi:peptide/nickel transport system substrate-binding protein